MIRIAIVTTHAPERCGLRVYSEELVKSAIVGNEDLHFTFVGRPFDHTIIDRVRNMDVVHVMHVTNLFGGLHTPHIYAMKSAGLKTVCTWHDSSGYNLNPFTEAFDRVVVHQKSEDGFAHIYHGCPYSQNLKPERALYGFIGTSGFPLPFKNYPLAARLAKAVGKKLYAFLPESQHGDAYWAENQIQLACPGSIVQKGFPPHDVIVDTLAQCDFSLFPYRHETTGVGGSMRVGIGAQRPVVISNVVRFTDVLSEERFRNEFYVIPSAYPTYEDSIETVKQCAEDVVDGKEKIPVETFKEMSWMASAQKYVSIYRELMGS